MRISQSNLDALFASLVEVAQRHVHNADKWVLYHGTPVFTIVILTEGGGHSTVVSYIGRTKGEAYDYLTAMRTAYHLASYPKTL